MKLLLNLLTVLIVLATVGVGVLFAVQNTVAVPLDMLVYEFAPRSLALWVLLAFAVGGILGMLISSALMVRLRTTLGRTRRQLAKSRDEIGRLQSQGSAVETQ